MLFVFHTDMVVATTIQVETLDVQAWRVEASLRGDIFDRTVHESGTEIKAITYSAMDIIPEGPNQRAEVYVIVDI